MCSSEGGGPPRGARSCQRALSWQVRYVVPLPSSPGFARAQRAPSAPPPVPPSWLDQLAQWPDPRLERTKRPELVELVAITLLAVLAAERAILQAEGPRHVDGRCYANPHDAERQRRWAAADAAPPGRGILRLGPTICNPSARGIIVLQSVSQWHVPRATRDIVFSTDPFARMQCRPS